MMSRKQKYQKSAFPLTEIIVTIIPAIKISVTIAGKAYLNLILKIKAAKLAVQDPVVGRGTAVKIIKASAPYFSTLSLLLMVLLSSQSKKIAMIRSLFTSISLIGSRNNSRGITGNILPATAIQ